MRLLITFLMGLSLSIAGLPGLRSISWAATAAGAGSPASPRPTVQGRAKKRRPKARKIKATKTADKKPDKKNDRGFEL